MRQLIGREREQREVADRLRERRLVTLIGPAGVGKTALARSVAERVGSTFQFGAHHVDLTRVDSPAAVADAIASQLGASSFEALLAAPSDRPALLVVDNCEHVIDAAADSISRLLAACASPTVLATSRSPLGTDDESLVALAPLGLSAPGRPGHDCDAVRLLLERVRDAGGEVDDDDPAVAELSRRLDGLPLALELAAALTRLMRPAEILDRLAEGIDVLDRPRFRGDDRHRSLATTIEWSFRLLPTDVAAMLDRLGLVAGPFTADLALAVAADVGIAPADAPDALSLLVDASLVTVEPTGDTTRFRVFETVRSCAVHHLAARSELEPARDRMADHVVRAAVALLDDGGRRWDRTTFARLHALYDAMAATLRWCLDHDEEPTRATLLGSVLWGVVHQGHTVEIADLTSAVIERWPDPSRRAAPDVAATCATARYLLGDHDGAIDLAERTLPWAEGGLAAPVTLRRAIGYASSARGDDDAALTAFEDAAAIARQRGLLALALEADVTRAQLLARHDPVAARGIAAAAEREAAAAGSVVNEVWARTVGALVALHLDPVAGRPLVVGALDAARRLDYPAAMSVGLRSLAWSSTRDGDHVTAATALLELIDQLLLRGGVAELRGALSSTADLLAAVGDGTWTTALATARSLPSDGLTGCELDPLVPGPPPPDAPVVSRRDAVVLARRGLRRILDGADLHVASAVATPASSTTARFVVHGRIVHVEFAGRHLDLPASKGTADLARLLATPDREVHCLELAGAAVDQSSAGGAIDETARRAYEARIRELQDDLDEADAHHDVARSERVAAELDALVAHLASSLGLGGRARPAGANAERARSAVTQRVRATIRRLQRDHPELGRHLAASIRTGTFCAYRPEHPVDWDLRPSDPDPVER